MRERPIIVAPAYINGPTTLVDFGHHRPVSAVAAAAAANAVAACRDGSDVRLLSLNPAPNLKSCALESAVTNGRDLPATPLSNAPTASASPTASVPCKPRSATRSQWPKRPAPYNPAP